MRRLYAVTLCIVLILSSFSACAGFSREERLVRRYFECLQEMDFAAAGKCLGDEEIYSGLISDMDGTSGTDLYGRIQATYFASFIYTRVSVRLIGCEKDGSDTLVTADVTACDSAWITEKVTDAQLGLTESDEYLAAEPQERYLMLCNNIPEIYMTFGDTVPTVTSRVVIQVTGTGEGMHIVPQDSLFRAIGGAQ